MAEKYKPSEIYRRTCEAYKEASFSPKIFTSGQNIGLPQRTYEKIVHGVKTLSGKENVPGTAVSKEGYTDSLVRYERNYHNWFSWKKGQL